MSNLILTRRPGETICIGDDIVVTLLGIKGTQARISVNAPAEMAVDREEIRMRKDAGQPAPEKQYGESTLRVPRK